MTQKDSKTETWNTTRVRTSSAAGKRGAHSKAVAGFIECGDDTVSGGLLASCRGLRWDRHCVFRTRSKRLVAVVNSEHCKWCKCATSVQESDVFGFRTTVYLQGMFRLSFVDHVNLAKLISELKRTQTKEGETHSGSVTATDTYCTVEDVTHISGLALQKLSEFDKEFLWGDNLMFNTKRSESGSR